MGKTKTSQFIKILTHLDMLFCGASLILIIIMTLVNVICRYLFGFFIASFEEVSLILFIWFCYIGAVIVLRNGSQISIDSIYNLLPVKVKSVIDAFIDIIEIIVCVYMTKLAFSLCLNARHKVTTYLRLPYVVYDAALAVSFLLMSTYCILLTARKILAYLSEEE